MDAESWLDFEGREGREDGVDGECLYGTDIRFEGGADRHWALGSRLFGFYIRYISVF